MISSLSFKPHQVNYRLLFNSKIFCFKCNKCSIWNVFLWTKRLIAMESFLNALKVVSNHRIKWAPSPCKSHMSSLFAQCSVLFLIQTNNRWIYRRMIQQVHLRVLLFVHQSVIIHPLFGFCMVRLVLERQKECFHVAHAPWML